MSSLGNSLYSARKSKGLTQEEVAEKLGVSRQTISKWELDETLPDIRQAKSLAQLYHTTLDDLLQYDAQVEEIQRVIRHTSEETQQKVDWTKLWGEMYPVLTTYPQQVDIPRYTAPLAALLQDLESTYHYTPLDAFLVLKDILGKMWDRAAPRRGINTQKSLPNGEALPSSGWSQDDAFAGHLGGLLQAQNLQHGGGDVRQAAAFPAAGRGG